MIHGEWFGDEAAGDRAPLVLLHEGLGSISAWRGFPQALADGTGRRVLAYDRPGYGRSSGATAPWPADFLERGAVELAGVLVEHDIHRPIFVGHSDGASIALLHPAHGAPTGGPDPLAIVSLSAHVLVEDVTTASIAALDAGSDSAFVRSLERHHDDAAALVAAWTEVWLSDRFRPWTAGEALAAVSCPVVAVQGADDRFGTRLQLDRIAAGVAGSVEVHELDGVDHWPHRDRPAEVVALTAELADRVDP
ncbi:MAG: alpha/beta hydrolase [Actinomycetota bacterium]